MRIEWDESVRRSGVLEFRSTTEDSHGCVRTATVDDLRRACEAAGLTLASAQHAEDLAKLAREMSEVVAQRDEARADYHAAVDRALDAHRVLGAMHNEGTLDAARRVVAERDDARGSLDAVSARLADHLYAPLQGGRVPDVLSSIDTLAQRVKDARSDYREHDVKLSYVVDQITTIVDEAFGMQPVMTHEELLSFLEDKIKERGRDLAAARARIAELEAAPVGLPVATDEELWEVGDQAWYACTGNSTESRHAGALAVAARVRAERPTCLVERAVALGCDVRVCEDVAGWLVAIHESSDLDEDVHRDVAASDVPATLSRLLDEVEASRKAGAK